MEIIQLLLSNFGTVFAIVDPFGYVPIFLSMTASDTDERRRVILKKACLTSGAVLIISTFLGREILGFFGISLPALQISGGLVLLAIAFEMLKVLPVHEKVPSVAETAASAHSDISIVPLAIPMLAGPASIAAVVVVSSQETSTANSLSTVLSIVITLGFTYLVLRSASKLMKAIGLVGLNVLTRVMGLLLCALAVQFIIDGYMTIAAAIS